MNQEWTVHLSTLNCAKNFPFQNEDALVNIFGRLLPVRSSHDIYVFGFQELVSTWEASFPLAVEPLMSYLANLAVSCANSLSEERRYKLIGTTFTGAVGIVVLADERFKVENVTFSNFRCGLLNSSLKGSATVCCSLRKHVPGAKKQTYTFICSHLNANEGPKNAALRLENYKETMSCCAADLKSTPFKKGHIFFIGDLNFRVNGWHDMQTNYSDETILNKLLENHEELLQLRKNSAAFKGFTEPPITFPPTYKYLLSNENVFNDKRTPSWCDRILFRQYKDQEGISSSYNSVTRHPELQFTDHQAVTLDITVPSIIAGEPLNIDARFPSDNQRKVGEIADMFIGYGGWLIFVKAHYGILCGLAIYILYKLY